MVTRSSLRRSLARQRKLLDASIVLTPVDNFPLLSCRRRTAFLEGLYVSDKRKTREEERESIIRFPSRGWAARDLHRIHALWAERLGGAEGSLKLLSGLHAHAVVFMSIAAIGQKVLLLPESAGGHFSTKRILERLGLQIVEMVVDRKRLCVDKLRTLDLVQKEHPSFIFVDRSEGLRYEDFSFLGEVKGPHKVFDASHYLPQLLTGAYPNPLSYGFDLLLFSLHKSFPGPQKAGVVGKESGGLWDTLLDGLGFLISSAHIENTYLAGLALLQERELAFYSSRLVQNALALEDALRVQSVGVFPRELQGTIDWPPTHHIWVRFPQKKAAYDAYRSLAAVRLHTNYRKLPYHLGWGLRLGTSAITMRGMRQSDAEGIAKVISDRLSGGERLEIRHRVRGLAARMAVTALSDQLDG